MRLNVSAIEYIHPKYGKRWVVAWDNLNDAIAWIRKYPTVEVTNMAVGSGYFVDIAVRMWIAKGAENQAEVKGPDTPTSIQPDQERRVINLPDRY